MNTLSISEIFSNIEFYQENYLSILNHPDQYFTKVHEAYIQVWPFAKKSLYLGDLLQLWFAEKWFIQSEHTHFLQNLIFEQPQNTRPDLYLYQLQGNALTGINHSHAWSFRSKSEQAVQVRGVLQHVCEYKALATVQTQAELWFHTKPVI